MEQSRSRLEQTKSSSPRLARSGVAPPRQSPKATFLFVLREGASARVRFRIPVLGRWCQSAKVRWATRSSEQDKQDLAVAGRFRPSLPCLWILFAEPVSPAVGDAG